jgi:lipopolysaccharide transport system ATP-binding protein
MRIDGMSTVIRLEGIGKSYLIHHQRRANRGTLRDAMTHLTRGAWQRVRHPLSPNRERLDTEQMWALKDVSFEVHEGERLGIIGRNGAGKSTLLKILSRITHPTTGRVHLRGRVSSLLEVGTGFHPELTGRENVFLNGAILGMTRREIKKKFDAIVAFAEVEKFLDTPVKRYSSGMYVRLAFAVAAHLEPEILIVDEVLAVGDAEFQKKCLGKMQSTAREGRTVLFVSHNMGAIQRLCSRAILMDRGQVALDSTAAAAINAYMGSRGDGLGRETGTPDGCLRVMKWELREADTHVPHSCFSSDTCTFVFTCESKRVVPKAQFGFVLRNLQGDLLISSNSRDAGGAPVDLDRGLYQVTVRGRVPVRAGQYQLEFTVAGEQFDLVDHWECRPLLSVLPRGTSVLSDEWQGWITEPFHFGVAR